MGDDAHEPAPASPWARMASDDPLHWPVGRLLSAAARRVEREWNAHLAGWDLNHASLPVLVLLAHEPRSQRELADACSVTEQTMSRILARMERTGYVTRAPHATDRRKVVLAITDAGREVAVKASDRRPADAMTTRGLTPEQVEQLRALLAVVARPATGTADGAQGGSPDDGDDDAPGDVCPVEDRTA
ncbi:MarR family winged helix-turn-helix transcriptional regulator [Cellulomonas cellasea]|uniref:DNA-binding MarR family transcriptional regulator n=1 Tax=Cellulomonas cellasea TaxID=43670 RepID=A0A7W4Y9F3_9CELL|nr:MarR family transcriptional regulator [Cellulomonas cellasea]MBB2921518.1 DNA-binding MarR family transcriptional regulator [Cellulomonas cellasea]